MLISVEDRQKEMGYPPIICIDLGSRNTKGVTASREANVLSLPRTIGKDGLSRGCELQHVCAMFQSSIIFEEIPAGMPGRVPLITSSGIRHDCLRSLKGLLPDRTYTAWVRSGR